VLPLAIVSQQLEPVAGRDAQGRRCGGGVELQQLASGDPLDVPEPGDGLAMEQVLCVGAVERADR
jgi:hypothetical protein